MAKAPRETGTDKRYAKRTALTVAAPTAPGASYVQAEAASMKTAVDALRAACKAAGIIV